MERIVEANKAINRFSYEVLGELDQITQVKMSCTFPFRHNMTRGEIEEVLDDLRRHMTEFFGGESQ